MLQYYEPQADLGTPARVDERTIGVVPTLGVTFTCAYEPVADVAAALDDRVETATCGLVGDALDTVAG